MTFKINSENIDSNVSENIAFPVGTVIAYASTTIPEGWLLCNGGSFSSTNYPELASILESTYQASSGTTYYLPNMINHFASSYTNNNSASIKSNSNFTNTHSHSVTGTGTQTTSNSDLSHTHFSNLSVTSASETHSHSVNTNRATAAGDYPPNTNTTRSSGSQSFSISDSTHRHNRNATITSDSRTGTHNHPIDQGSAVPNVENGITSHAHTYSLSGSSGNISGTTNMPPHIKLYYIIKAG